MDNKIYEVIISGISCMEDGLEPNVTKVKCYKCANGCFQNIETFEVYGSSVISYKLAE